MSDVTVQPEVELEVRKVLRLLKLRDSQPGLPMQLSVERKLKEFPENIRNLAEAQLRGEYQKRDAPQPSQPGTSLEDIKKAAQIALEDFNHDVKEMAPWITNGTRQIIEAQARLTSAKESIANISKALDGGAKIDFIKGELAKVKAKFKAVENSLGEAPPSLEAWKSWVGAISKLTQTQPGKMQTVEEVDELKRVFAETLQLARTEVSRYQGIEEKIRDRCLAAKESLDELITYTVTTASVATKSEVVKWWSTIEGAATGALDVANMATGEPLSNTILTSFKLLLQGISQGCKELFIQIKAANTTLEEGLKDWDPFAVAQRNINLIKDWAGLGLSTLSYIPAIGGMISTAAKGLLSVCLNSLLGSAKAKYKEQKKGSKGSKQDLAEKAAETAKELAGGALEHLAEQLQDRLGEILDAAPKQIKEIITGGSPEEWLATEIAWITESVLTPIFEKMIPDSWAEWLKPVEASDITGFLKGLDTEAKEAAKERWLTPEVQNLLDKAGKGAKDPFYSPKRAFENNKKVLKGTPDGEGRAVYVGKSMALEADGVDGGVALVIGSTASGVSNELDINFVLLLNGGSTGTVTVYKASKNPKRIAEYGIQGTLEFEGVPKDLVETYFKNHSSGSNELSAKRRVYT